MKMLHKTQVLMRLSVALSMVISTITLTKVAQARANTGTGVAVKIEGKAPGIEARLEMHGSSYTQDVILDVPKGYDMDLYRGQVLDGSIMQKVSEWVQEANYSVTSKTANKYAYKLAIGKMGRVYTHRFNCQDDVSNEVEWQQNCKQIPNVVKDEKSVVNGGITAVACQDLPDSGAEGQTRCVFSMEGTASSIPFILGDIKSETVIGILFREFVNYVSHLGLILNGNAGSVDAARAAFKGSSFEQLLMGIDARLEEGERRKKTKNGEFILEAALDMGGAGKILNSMAASRVAVTQGR